MSTPIQEAIKYVESQMEKWRRTDSIDAPIYTAYELTKNHLESLLPKEKEFVSEVWAKGLSRGYQEGKVGPNSSPTLPEFINQLYPEK